MHKKISRSILLVLFLVLSIAGVWYYTTERHRLMRIRHLRDSQWISQHTPQEVWGEAQFCFTHWPGSWRWGAGVFCLYADESWVAWILADEQIPLWDTATYELGDIFPGLALKYVTNQCSPFTRQEWLEWWKSHRSETQANWVRIGFEDVGIIIDPSPTETQKSQLLQYLGDGSKSNDSPCIYRGIYVFNAVRLLRWTELATNAALSECRHENFAQMTANGMKKLAEFRTLNIGASESSITGGVKRGKVLP